MLAKELADVCRRVDDYEYGRAENPTYKADKARLREIGIAANTDGGFAAMLNLARAATQHYRNVGNTVNGHWHGIGEWAA